MEVGKTDIYKNQVDLLRVFTVIRQLKTVNDSYFHIRVALLPFITAIIN